MRITDEQAQKHIDDYAAGRNVMYKEAPPSAERQIAYLAADLLDARAEITHLKGEIRALMARACGALEDE